eukprot:1748-Heterococcus_DN1.PRE.4
MQRAAYIVMSIWPCADHTVCSVSNHSFQRAARALGNIAVYTHTSCKREDCARCSVSLCFASQHCAGLQHSNDKHTSAVQRVCLSAPLAISGNAALLLHAAVVATHVCSR